MKTDNWNSEEYKQYHDTEEHSVFSIFPNHNFHGNETILDVGCGDGKLTAELAKKLPKAKIVGIDYSKSMIDGATKNYSHIPNLSFQQEDASNFSLNESFDFAFSFRALHWVKDKEGVFKCLYEALKPDGAIVINMGAKEKSCISCAFEELCDSNKWSPRFEDQAETYFSETAEDTEEYLKKAGFKKYRIEKCYTTHSFENQSALLSWLVCWVPHCVNLKGDDDNEFSRDVAKHLYEQKKKSPSDTIEFKLVTLHIEATR